MARRQSEPVFPPGRLFDPKLSFLMRLVVWQPPLARRCIYAPHDLFDYRWAHRFRQKCHTRRFSHWTLLPKPRRSR